MSLSLCEADLIADFDARFGKGLIFYQDNPAIQTRTIDGFKVRRRPARLHPPFRSGALSLTYCLTCCIVRVRVDGCYRQEALY